jgi:hypothetical protein
MLKKAKRVPWSAGVENSVGPFRFGAFGAALPLPVVRVSNNGESVFWLRCSLEKNDANSRKTRRPGRVV